MKKASLILLFTVFALCVAVGFATPQPVVTKRPVAQADTVAKADSAFPKKFKQDTLTTDTTRNPGDIFAVKDDSIYLKQIDSLQIDTTTTDSTRKKSNTVDRPIKYSSRDSMTYDAQAGKVNLFGSSEVEYQDMNLVADIISMDLDSNLIVATYSADSTGEKIGKPVFTQGQDSYEMEKITYNIKTRKGFIRNVTTEQGDGYMQSQESKRDGDGVINLKHGTYTTCDANPPHFHISLSRAKVYPGKEAFAGPSYVVVEGVPLPIAIPFFFFPFSNKYSSGLIVPTFGSETERGFYLKDGGYYFAINDKIDLHLLGEIYTKGSWGVNASSTYRKRYKYSGNFYVNYLNTVDGEKNMPDYSVTKSLKLQWTHRQDPKASVNSTFSASVNYASESFERKNLSSLYNPLTYSQSTRTSSVSYSYTFPNIGLTLSSSANLSQNMRDSTIAMTMPDLNINKSRFYPFKRKKLRGKEKWYEKISMSYTGQLSNSISTKEDQLMKSDLVKDWRNGMQHSIPVSATFQLFKYINITPSFSFKDRMYTNKVMQDWDVATQAVRRDTLYGFYNVYNWDLSLNANTTVYGMYKPSPAIFGDKIIAVRHVLKPSVSFSYAPDFSSATYGYYESYTRTDAKGNVSTVEYSPYANSLYGYPGRGRTGSISMNLSNNVEMKVRSDRDSTGEKKISIIDELSGALSYNMAATTHKWSDLTTRLRLKLSKNYTFSMTAVWATYAYEFDKSGNVIVGNSTEWSHGRFGRFQGMSQNFHYTLSNSTFSKKKRHKAEAEETDNEGDVYNEDFDAEDSNLDPDVARDMNHRPKDGEVSNEIDEYGYLKFSIPWTFTISYGINMRENTQARIRTKNMRYPYKLTHTLNFSGNVRLSEGWNINYASGYDFNFKKLSTTTASLMRDLHCFSMSCSIVLMPYTSFNFTFRAKMSTLADVLKWEKRSSYSTNVEWY